jgi:hypothetical protein
MATSFRSLKGLISGLRRFWRRRDPTTLWPMASGRPYFYVAECAETSPLDVESNEHNGRPPAFGYEETREAAMAAFAKLAAGLERYTESRCGD